MIQYIYFVRLDNIHCLMHSKTKAHPEFPLHYVQKGRGFNPRWFSFLRICLVIIPNGMINRSVYSLVTLASRDSKPLSSFLSGMRPSGWSEAMALACLDLGALAL